MHGQLYPHFGNAVPIYIQSIINLGLDLMCTCICFLPLELAFLVQASGFWLKNPMLHL